MTTLPSRQNVRITGSVDGGTSSATYVVGCEKYGRVNLSHAAIRSWNMPFQGPGWMTWKTNIPQVKGGIQSRCKIGLMNRTAK
jgi:hypothetical protein